MTPFVLFGPAHLCALAAIGLLAFAAITAIRRRPRRLAAIAVRWSLAAALAGLVAAELAVAAREHWLSLEAVAPLQLCDAAVLLSIYALVTQHRLAAELLYFWACSGTAIAALSPDLLVGFPRWEFILFFGLHGLVVVSALVLVAGCGLAPRPGAAWRAFIATNAYATLVGAVDALAGTNYLYLCNKPTARTLLDSFGPWPLYLIVCDALALAIFWVLALPFRRPFQEREGP